MHLIYLLDSRCEKEFLYDFHFLISVMVYLGLGVELNFLSHFETACSILGFVLTIRGSIFYISEIYFKSPRLFRIQSGMDLLPVTRAAFIPTAFAPVIS